MDCIRVENLHKQFGDHQVLKGLNFSIEHGETTAFLGHNGAGKTTLLRILLGLLENDEGKVSVFGKDPFISGEQTRKMCGVLCEDTGLYESLSVYENLKFFAKIYGCEKTFYESRIDELLERFEIRGEKNHVIKNFSMGMKKKVAIIRTLLHQPKLVLMDEPVNALDPISIETFHEIMREMKDTYQTTFILTTHNLAEVMQICDKIIILRDGKNVVEKTLTMGEYLNTHIELIDGADKERIDQVLKDKGIGYWFNHDEVILRETDKYRIARIISEMVEQKVGICGVVRDHIDINKLYKKVEDEANA